MSTNTGLAPAATITQAVATKEFGQVITSSPGPTPRALRIRNSASDPLATPSAWGTSQYAAASASNRSTVSPRMYWPLAPMRSNSAVSSSRMLRYCRSRLTNGTCIVGPLSIEELPDRVDDAVLLLARDELVDRQGQHGPHDGLADREVARGVAEELRRRLQVHRNRVVHLCVDPAADEELLKLVAPLAAHDIEVIDLLDPGLALGHLHLRDRPQPLVEVRRVGDARLGDVVDLVQEVPRDDGLDGVQARVVAEHGALVAADQAVVAQQPQGSVEILGVGRDDPAVAPDI